jgi:cGMP-dependent protein kinase
MWSDILKSLKCSSNPNISIYERVLIMKNIQLFSNLSEWKIFQLAENLKTEIYKDKQILIKNGPPSDKFFIIKSGQVRAFIGEVLIKEFGKNESFGDISSGKRYSKSVTFATNERTECYVLEKEIFDEIIDSSLFKPLEKIFVLKDITITLDNLHFVKELGVGSHGKVYLVHNLKNLYAVKTAEIKSTTNHKLLRYYINEKNIMSAIDHPFIVKLVNTFKTKQHLFFLMEYIDGITVKQYFDGRRRDQLRDLNETQFFGAILFSIVGYLQRMRVIHRDFKPSNCIIDQNGYLKLIDFGVAKDLTGKDYTSTILGTAHYMPPEMLLGQPYSFASDYWSAGILLFEWFYGYYPFGHTSIDVFEVYDEITEK